MVVQGHPTTLPVSLDDVVYHTQCVSRGCENALVIADMPFGSFQGSPQSAFDSAARLMGEGKARCRSSVRLSTVIALQPEESASPQRQ